MKILSATQIRDCDAFTIEREGIASFALMERAAMACYEWIRHHHNNDNTFIVLCGMGNNGGDGLALTRILIQEGYDARAFVWKHTAEFSKDAAENFKLLQSLAPERLSIVDDLSFINNIPPECILVDAFLGTGLSRKVDGDSANFINALNELPNTKIAVDIPSGLFADSIPEGHQPLLKADTTLSFQFVKRSFLHQEAAIYTGAVQVLPIGLDQNFIQDVDTNNYTIDEALVKSIYKSRSNHSHKGTYGTAMLIGGSYGKMGAIALSTQAALRSGAGLVYTQAPECGYYTLQTLAPEAMFMAAGKEIVEHINTQRDKPMTIGIGPGMGTDELTANAFKQLLQATREPMVIDADALNICSQSKSLLSLVPENSVLTPHPKEFERLFGITENSMEQVELARKKAVELGIFIVLKRSNTAVLTPDGQCYYNTTGNPGMATGGSGDVLTGIIAGLIAQKYTAEHACLLGVYLHGRAGDIAAQKLSQEAMLASDIISNIGEVFKELSNK